MADQRMITVPVPGGELTAAVWGTGTPTVLAIHGLTASHVSWGLVAAEAGVTIVAPDLRGRGASNELPAPYGMLRHAEDCAAVLDRVGADPALVAGHSMGGFIAVTLAHRYPERVRRLMLIDGGVPFTVPDGVSPDDMITATVGPAVQRLDMTFESRQAYHDWWQQHPAMQEWNDTVAEYVDYDLAGEPPQLRSRTSKEAVRADSVDMIKGTAFADAYDALPADVEFLRAERGLLDQPTPLYPNRDKIAERMLVRDVADTNHYSIVLGERGATEVAAALAAR